MRPTMNLSQRPHAVRQRGSFLLEALVAILIVALGVLGSVGLLARSMQDIDDAKFRGEAAYLANSLIGQMWLDDKSLAALDAKYGKIGGGAGYLEFDAMVQERLPNATTNVIVGVGPTPTSSNVQVQITWHMPGDLPTAPDHLLWTYATIGANQ
jgi:type IV pilus assembly protein PilV